MDYNVNKMGLMQIFCLLFIFNNLQARGSKAQSNHKTFNKQQPVSFSAPILFADRKKKITRLQGGVFIKQGFLEINATQAQLFFNAPGERLSKIKAQGKVIIIRRAYEDIEEIKLLAAHATYLVFSDKLILEKDVVLYQVDTKIKADRLTYHIMRELLQMESVSGSLSTRDKTKKQM